MESQLTSMGRASNRQHRSHKSNIISQSLHRQKASAGNEIPDTPNMYLKSRRMFYLCMRSKKTNILAIVLFINLAMLVGILTVYLTSPKPNGKCQRDFHRIMKSSLRSNSQPRSIALADLNNNHQIDIVVANSGTNTIGIFTSKGDGNFTDQGTYFTGSESHPYSIVVSNFNDDHYLDIAVANYGTNNIGIFLGKGNGTFTDQKLFSLDSSRPLFVDARDLNKDDRIDIIVVNNGTNTIGILFGYGNGSFQDQVTYFTGYDSFPCSLAIGDFNNDDELDIAVANYGTNNIIIFFGYDNGTLRNEKTYTTTHNSNPSSIAVGDINNDKQLDIIVSNYGTGNIGIFFNHGNGSFLPQTTYSIGKNSYPQYITVGDVNKDDKSDIVVIDSKHDQIHILLVYGNGSLAAITTYDEISGSNPFWIALGDFNNNNQSDIAVVNYDTSNMLVLIDYSIKASARQTNCYDGQPGTVAPVSVSDFNNDHIPDIVFITGNDMLILNGLDNGTFSKQTRYSTGYDFVPQYFCVGDMNNDNRMDIVLASKSYNAVGVLLGKDGGTFDNITTYSTGVGSQPWWIALGDFNHDNVLDIVSANAGTSSVGILLGNGNGTIGTVVIYSSRNSSYPHSVAVGIINNDNYLDLVVGNGDSTVDIFFGQGDGTFIIMFTYSTGVESGLFSIALADFNNDNHLDIVVANTFTDNIGVFLGYDNGTFAPQITYSTGFNSQPYYVIAADFNNDNISDIVATIHGNDTVVIFYGSSNGNFELTRIYSTGFGSKPYGVTTADLNNDKQLEIVVALWGSGDIVVLTEYYAAEFVHQTDYSTGSTSQLSSVDVGDFNNDNQSDIVVANSGIGSLDIVYGSNNGTLDMETIYSISTDSYPQYVITCDINKDNYIDIITVNSKNNSVSIIMGYGNGSFAAELIYSTGDDSHPSTVTCSDLNNDTQLDLVIANEGTDNVGVFYGFNYTSFQDQVIYSSNFSQEPYGVIVNDFNNDTFLDIATVLFGINSLGILLGYGNGSFTDIMIYSTGIGSGPLGLDAGDFNNDGILDIVVANYVTDNIGIFLGCNNVSFATIMTYSTGYQSGPKAVIVGDLNDDHRLDIVVANYYANNVGVLFGYGNGTFSIVQTYFTGQASRPYSVTLGDFNNDRRLDIAVANRDTSNIGVLLGYGDGTFGNQMTFSTNVYSYPCWVTVGDFDRDNQLDIAVAIKNSNIIGILLGYGNGSFAPKMTYSTGSGSLPICISVDDFNDDNILDIAVANLGTNNIVVFFGFGDGDFLLGKSYSTGSGSQPYGIATGDFNKDGRSDVVIASYFPSNIRVFLAYGSEPFGGMTIYTTGSGSSPHSVTTGDLNSDSRLDIIVANYGTNNIGIFLGHNNRFFDSMIVYPTGDNSAPYSVDVADLNNDTHVDIVVSNSEIDNIIILLGYGNGTFVVGTTYFTGDRSRPYGIAINDFNNDKISDIVVANSGTNNILLFYGFGNGTFGNETSYPLGYEYQPYSVTVRDLNGDGWIDMIIACYYTDHVEIFMNMC